MSAAPLIFSKNDIMALVFRLPPQVPSDFCFGGGFPVLFQLVDWFEVRPNGVDQEGVRLHIRKRPYYQAGCNYLVLQRNGTCYLVDEPKS